jgi:myosin XV
LVKFIDLTFFVFRLSLNDKFKSFMYISNSDIIEKIKNLRLCSKSKEWTWTEYADMIKFSKSPIQTSLLKLETNELTQKAIECFIEIMRFMGDYPLSKNQTSNFDCLQFIMKTLSYYNELCDECYCQIIKQTTNNKSINSESCLNGWKLLTIICSYFKSTDLLKPYLFKYIENNAYDTKRNYTSIAQIALNCLRKTFKYGGRCNLLNKLEFDAIMVLYNYYKN